MRTGCGPDFPGADVPAPAEDVHNENPSLVALGKNYANAKDFERFFHGSDADRMRTGCVADFPGADVPAPAEDLHNENPSLVALGKNFWLWDRQR